MTDTEQEKTDLAVRHYKEVVRINHRNSEAYLKIGALLGEKGRPDEAIVFLNRAVEIDPRSHAVRYSLGVVLFQMERFEEARDNLRKALPGFEKARDQSTASRIRLLMSKIDEIRKSPR